MNIQFYYLSILEKSLRYKKYVVDKKLCYFKPHSTKIEKSFSEEVTFGLGLKNKMISPKFFYDIRGSGLFDKICTLPEYYLTRTEIEILNNIRDELALVIDSGFRLVELGSGSSTKTRIILDVLDKIQPKIEYFPIDISEILTESSEILLDSYPKLHITGIIDTYEGGLQFIEEYDDKNNLIIFLGSSLGNFTETDTMNFLKQINSVMKKSDLFLIGLDLVKDKKILDKAYDDSQGITSQFNLNVLQRINSELGGNFNLKNFEHYAFYNLKLQRIEMYLKSKRNQTVHISKTNNDIKFNKNELIHTEYSQKYTIPQIKKMMNQCNFKIKNVWLDSNQYYCVLLASKF
jgi:dimethylhistidine N-methyltransferase